MTANHEPGNLTDARYRLLVEASGEVVFTTDAHGHFDYVNPAGVAFLGQNEGDIIGRSFTHFVAPSHRADVLRTYVDQLRRRVRRTVLEFPAITPNGERWIEQTVVLLTEDDAVTGFLGFVRDIDDRKRTEDALRQAYDLLERRVHERTEALQRANDDLKQQEAFLRQLIDINPSYIFVKSADGKFVLANQAVADLYGVTTQDLIGKTDLDFGADPETVEHFRRDDAEVLATLRPKFIPEEKTVNPRTGQIQIFQTTKVPVIVADGGPPHVLGVATDITARKRGEEHSLALAVERERVQMLADFIRNASHDFRTPLSTINTSLYLLEKAPTPEKQRKHLAVIHKQTAQLAKLLEGLLTMTRLDSEAEFRFAPVNVNALVEIVALRADLKSDAHADAALSLNLQSDLPPVDADAVELKRALYEVVHNAFLALNGPGRVDVRTYTSGNSVVVEVTDNGVGISGDDLPRIFERFYRADKARSADTGGVGLGLSIAQKILEGHGGLIEVESAPGQGSTFRIILAASAGSQADQYARTE